MSEKKLIPGMSYRVKIEKEDKWRILEFDSIKTWRGFFIAGSPVSYFSLNQVHEIDYTPIDPNPDNENPKPFTGEMESFLLVNTMRSLHPEQQITLAKSIMERNPSTERKRLAEMLIKFAGYLEGLQHPGYRQEDIEQFLNEYFEQ